MNNETVTIGRMMALVEQSQGQDEESKGDLDRLGFLRDTSLTCISRALPQMELP